MNMVEVTVDELSGPALDWAVAEVDGVKTLIMSPRKGEPKQPFALFGSLALSVGGQDQSSYAPSTCWHCCGPLIVSRMVAIDFQRPLHDGESPKWVAQCWRPYGCGVGDSPLVAACRAIVAAKLGDTVQIPAELLQ